MKYLTALIPLALSAQVLGLATPSVKRNTVAPSWELEVTPGGEKVILNGTVQEVHAELLKLNPNWDEDFSFNDHSSNLAKRTYFDPKDEHYCGGRFPVVDLSWKWAIDDGISYLRKVGGNPIAPTGPGWCSRVSCSNDAAIKWCNDDPAGKTLYSYGSIADGAQFILDTCGEAKDDSGDIGWSGQVFHPTKWNVIVEQELC